MTTIHATAIALGGRAALIRGPSGSGKSDLALRCICHPPTPFFAAPARLISDDQTVVAREPDGSIWAAAPPSISGLMEVRGVGLIAVETEPRARVCLLVDLAGPAPERLPDPLPVEVILGEALPVLRINAFEASSALKLLIALAGHAGIADTRFP